MAEQQTGGDAASVRQDTEQMLSVAGTFLAFRKRYPLSVITGTMVAHLWFQDEVATLCGIKAERLDRYWTMLEGCPRCAEQASLRMMFSPEELASRLASFQEPVQTWLATYFGVVDGKARSLRQVAIRAGQGRAYGTVMSQTWKALQRLRKSPPGHALAPG